MEDQAQLMSSEEKDNVAGQTMESLGEPEENAEEIEESPKSEESGEQNKDSYRDDPLYVQKRLKRQDRAHQREMRMMQEQIQRLQSSMSSPQTAPETPPSADHFAAQGNDVIRQAVEHALRAKDDQERRAKDQERMDHVHKQYQALQSHLDNASDKYDDFDEVVRSPDAPFSDAMRDAAVLLPHNGSGSAADVLYKLGKNREELKRISSLHPLDQAKEMVKLSHALMQGGEKVGSTPRTLGQVKSNPVPSHGVTDKTSVSEIRRRMKAGWK